MTRQAARLPLTARCLAAALALGAALGGGPAHADELKLAVTAVILARDTCQVAILTTAGLNASLNCKGTAKATTVRVRGSTDLGPQQRLPPARFATAPNGVTRKLPLGATRAAGQGGEGPVILTIEP